MASMKEDSSGSSLPFNPTHPHDTLRDGLAAYKQDAVPSHAFETAQVNLVKQQMHTKRSLLETAYGSALPLRMDIEQKILSRVQRPPGLPSSMLGLESLTGELDEFGFGDFLNDPRESESVHSVEMHAGMEARLGLSRGPAAQTFL